jgi:hypothetical protein
LAKIFSVKVLQNYDEKKYKGLEVNPEINEVKKVVKGKKGIPIKYEDLE